MSQGLGPQGSVSQGPVSHGVSYSQPKSNPPLPPTSLSQNINIVGQTQYRQQNMTA